jgi:acyl-CoA thioesterase FadM
MAQIVEIHGHNADGADDLRAEVELVNVFVDLATHRPMVLPDWIARLFTDFDAKAENAPLLETVPAQ